MSGGGHDRETRRSEIFNRIFDEHWAPVRHHIEWIVDDDAEVSEVLSEVFLLAWSRLDPDRPMGLIWLLRAADRRLRGRARRPRPRTKLLEVVHEELGGEPHRIGPVGRAAVLDAFTALSARERRIIMLTYWDGLSVGDIAEMLRHPHAGVSRTLRRAQERLRIRLNAEGGQDE
ncbi:sigma-70 family RNA polymerase sigma factor [Microbacterium sp. LWH12-1.2]|uniref:sigma-70 family RNA polymerase sigma factor n=1 Tax=Microbacterium sp. LWH12-1.2 TaxID=3135259 RepID=UPI003448E437